MKNRNGKKTQQLERKAFLRSKREDQSKTNKVLTAATDNSSSVMHVRNRTGGRARKVRRG